MNELVGVFEKNFGKRGKRIFDSDKPVSVHSSAQATPRQVRLSPSPGPLAVRGGRGEWPDAGGTRAHFSRCALVAVSQDPATSGAGEAMRPSSKGSSRPGSQGSMRPASRDSVRTPPPQGAIRQRLCRCFPVSPLTPSRVLCASCAGTASQTRCRGEEPGARKAP